jgi:hypothetical protein
LIFQIANFQIGCRSPVSLARCVYLTLRTKPSVEEQVLLLERPTGQNSSDFVTGPRCTMYVGFSATTGVGSGVGVSSASDALVLHAVSMSSSKKTAATGMALVIRINTGMVYLH